MINKLWLLLPLIAGGAYAIGSQNGNNLPPERSPHAAALELVFRTVPEQIRKADQENWWHDIESRNWEVNRPFYPGIFDSTHLFNVTYRVKGAIVGQWLVDTKKGTVQAQPARDGK